MDRKGPWLLAEDAAKRVARDTLVAKHRESLLDLYGCEPDEDRRQLIGADIYLRYPGATLLRGNFFGVPASREWPMNVLFADVACREADLEGLLHTSEPEASQPLEAWLLGYAIQKDRKLKQSENKALREAYEAATGNTATWRQMEAAIRALPERYRNIRGKR